MGWVDRVPRAGNLYIGGLYALYQPNVTDEVGITHVLSVIDFDFYEVRDSTKFLKSKNYQHLMIRIEDDPNEDLLQHFERMNTFLDTGLSGNGGAFVHCAMGKSRSATAVVAYLMWKYGVTRDEGLNQVCEGRPVASPNPGFMEQLSLYEQMLKTQDLDERRRMYKTWLQSRFKGASHEWETRSMKSKL